MPLMLSRTRTQRDVVFTTGLLAGTCMKASTLLLLVNTTPKLQDGVTICIAVGCRLRSGSVCEYRNYDFIDQLCSRVFTQKGKELIRLFISGLADPISFSLWRG
uniref:Uncharacterized protein n=1 Tax=Hyaloperonospora arabidopsidis (strain Emoy2) TaxID=559515 RepID=M4B1B2_HYAAE